MGSASAGGGGGIEMSSGFPILSSVVVSLGRRDSVELCFFFVIIGVLNWESRMKRAFCSATWIVNSSSFVSQVGTLSVKCWKLPRGLTVAMLRVLAQRMESGEICCARCWSSPIKICRVRGIVKVVKSSKHSHCQSSKEL